jgi:hypothetical protein
VPERVLSSRDLNRALLARQLLLERATLAPLAALDHLVGMQAQVPTSPYIGLWSRLEGFDPRALGADVEERRAVRIALMRSTIHLVTADDALALRPVVAPVLARELRNRTWSVGLDGVDVEPALETGRAFVEARPATSAEIRAHYAADWPAVNAASLAHALRCLVALVQVPPRGVWGKAGRPTLTTAEHWLGRPVATDPAPDAAILRYLAAFGPASVADAQTWCGLQGLRAAFEGLRPRLRTYRDERGRELFDVADGPLPDPATPAPVRFLADYDNALLSHEDRSRIVRPIPWPRLGDNVSIPTFLVDGFVAGYWKLERAGRDAALAVHPLVPVSPVDERALLTEADRFLAFLAPGPGTREVRLHPVP